MRTWAAFAGGEIVLLVAGPDAEQMVRAVGERVTYRESEKPTAENGWALWGPWIDAD